MKPQNNIRIRVAVVIVEKDKILLVRHRKNGRQYWLLPGGGLEYGETIEECAQRELFEEGHIDIEVGDLLFVSESIPHDKHRHVVNMYYEAVWLGGELMLGQDKVLDDIKMVDISEVPDLMFFPNIKKELLDYLNNKRTVKKRSLGNRWE